ncbi:MAG TPA: extracellular solute-binding protein [Candidatus Paceibacterota bacterium]|nr:extracellular solute-binding protein [Candidatus Paceibacterota bacterium]
MQNSKDKRRGKVSIALLTIGTLISVVGGLAAASEANAARKKVTITFWTSYSASESPTLEKTLIPAFEKANPNIKVKHVAFSHDDLYQKLLTGVLSKTLPDVVRSDVAWVPTFAQGKIFAKLDGRGGMAGFTKLSKLVFKGPLSTNYYAGHYYGLPLDTNTRVMFANMDAFAKAGITTPPKTFAEMLADAPLLKAQGIQLYADGGTGGWNVLPWIWSAGGAITNATNTTAKGYINGAKSVSAVQFLTDLYKQGAISDTMLGASGGISGFDGVPKGNYAMTLDGPWMNPIWGSVYPDFKPVQALVPAGAGGSISVVGGEDINVIASTKNKAAAQQFVRFMLSKSAQTALLKAGQLTVLQSLRSQVTAIHPYYSTFLEQLATAKARTPVPNYPKIDQIIGTQVALAMQGKKTAQQAMNEAAALIEPLLK